MAKQIIESEQSPFDFEKERADLECEINQLTSEYKFKLDKITEARSRKTKAKKGYENELDQGDKIQMDAALTAIRQCNKEIDSLLQEQKKLPARLAELRVRQSELVTFAREQRPEAEKKLEDAREWLKIMDGRISQAQGLLAEINSLAEIIVGNKTPASL